MTLLSFIVIFYSWLTYLFSRSPAADLLGAEKFKHTSTDTSTDNQTILPKYRLENKSELSLNLKNTIITCTIIEMHQLHLYFHTMKILIV